MRRLDKLIVKEIVGPWLFGVALFGSLLFAATYLGRVADYVAKGIPGSMIGQFSLLLLPAILVQTFPMSMLLSSLLSFGRLSSDSEIVALRAAGVSLFRIIAPVSAFALLVAIVAFTTNEVFVPAAAKRSSTLILEIARKLDSSNFKATSYPIREDGKLKGMVVAKDFVPNLGELRGATVVAYNKDGQPTGYLYAENLQFDPDGFQSGNGWRIRGGAVLLRADGSERIQINDDVWPEGFQPNFTPSDILTKSLNSFESLSMQELRRVIDQEKSAAPEARTLKIKDLRNYEYGYWNKIALPLAALIFGTLGAALGIRNHRTGTAAGFALAVAIIFGYFTIANFMNVWALNGAVPPYVASFSPVAIGFIASIIIIWRRNA